MPLRFLLRTFLSGGMVVLANLPHEAIANPDEQAIARAMKAIGAAWTKAIAEQRPLIAWGDADCLSAVQYANPSQIDFDVKKTGNLLEPYKGVVMLRLQARRFDPKMECYSTPEAAIEASKSGQWREWTSPDQTLIAEYKITDDAITLDRANPSMRSAFANFLSRRENAERWSDVIQQRIR